MFPDVFIPDLFTVTSLTAAIDQVPYIPGAISRLGIFEEEGVETTSVVVEKQGNSVLLVPNAKRGASGQTSNDPKRGGYSFILPHLPGRDAILADSVQNVRAFGTSDRAVAVEAVRDRKILKMANNLDFTLEFHRMGAVQGRVLDADGSTVLFDLFTILGQAEPTEIDFDLDNAAPASGVVRTKCNQVVRQIEDALDGLPYTGVSAICDNTFWDQITAHKEVRETYLNQQEASDLRRSWENDVFHYGGIDFQRYRGRGAVALGAGKARFFPRGVAGLFITRFGPADYIETVNTIGLAKYAKAKVMDFDKGIELESQSNPLNICTIPAVLQRARNT
jgi:hypothetical protein